MIFDTHIQLNIYTVKCRVSCHSLCTKVTFVSALFKFSYKNGPIVFLQVKHFDRKYNYLKFKEKMEKEGFEPLKNK